MAGWEGKPEYTVLIDCLRSDDLPISLGRQEMTFEGFEGIDPATVFHVEGVRRHFKAPDPNEGRVSRRPAVWTPDPPPFIDATIYVRS